MFLTLADGSVFMSDPIVHSKKPIQKIGFRGLFKCYRDWMVKSAKVYYNI